jgi:hypothetical protein
LLLCIHLKKSRFEFYNLITDLGWSIEISGGFNKFQKYLYEKMSTFNVGKMF